MSSGLGALNFDLPSKDPGGNVKKPVGCMGPELRGEARVTETIWGQL